MSIKHRRTAWLLLLLVTLLGLSGWGVFSPTLLPPAVQAVQIEAPPTADNSAIAPTVLVMPTENTPSAADDYSSATPVTPTILAAADPLQPLAYVPAPLPTVVVKQYIAASPIVLPTMTPVMAKPTATAQTATQPPVVAPHYSGAGVPIMMYHHIAVPPTDADSIRRGLSVTPQSFAAQLDYLSNHDYHTITLARYVEWGGAMRLGRPTEPLPANPIVLTFDDGYDDIYTNAYPLLKAHGMAGTFFIISGKVGWEGYMSWRQLQEMGAAGMDIESHTVNHIDLAGLDPIQLKYELAESKSQLESGVGKVVTIICYPSGQYNQIVEDAAQQAGYTAATTTRYGWSQPGVAPFELPRVRVAGDESLAGFVGSIGGTLSYKERR